jgi:clathrin heavy chain
VQLECSEQLGDMIKTIEPRFALTCYLRGGAHDKVIQSFAETGEFEKIVLYAQKVGHTPNYAMILTMVLRSQPDKAVAFAQSLVKDPSKPLVDVRQLVQVFLQNQVRVSHSSVQHERNPTLVITTATATANDNDTMPPHKH